MQVVTIKGRTYLYFEDDEGRYYVVDAIKIESHYAYREEFDNAFWEALEEANNEDN